MCQSLSQPSGHLWLVLGFVHVESCSMYTGPDALYITVWIFCISGSVTGIAETGVHK